MIMKLKKNVALSESGFIFDSATGDSYSANPVGLRILELLKNGGTTEKIIERITSEFAVESSRAAQDLDDFTALLQQLYLTEDG